MSRSLIRVIVCAALSAGTGVVLAAEDAPKTEAAPTTRPSDGASKPTISPEAQKLVDQVSEAYAKLKSLELVGVFSGDIEAAGQKSGGSIAFTGSYEAPNKFRHNAKDEVVIGSSGEKTYLYAAQDKVYSQTDAPKAKFVAAEMPEGLHEILSNQDPSLELAIVKDAGIHLVGFASDIVKVDDTKVGDDACPTLKFTLKDKTSLTLAVDPSTHLVRQSSLDLRAMLEGRNIPDIKKAVYEVKYTTVTPDATVKPDQFAWAPPAGTKDMKDVKALADAGGGEEAAMALVGKVVPAFKLPGLDGKEISTADLKGQVYILDFWATWCGPCKASLPHLDELYQAEKEHGLKVYAVNLGDDKAKVEEFVKQTKLGVPVILDEKSTLSEPFMAEAIPETVLVGKDGKVAKVFIGFSEDETPKLLKAAIDAAMKK